MSPALRELVQLLDTELEILRRFGKELAGLHLLLEAGDAKYVSWAVDAVNEARDALGAVEIGREALTTLVAAEYGVSSASLQELAAGVPQGGGAALLAARDQLAAALRDVDELRQAALDAGDRGLHNLMQVEQDLLGALGEKPYGAVGGFAGGVPSPGAVEVDRRC